MSIKKRTIALSLVAIILLGGLAAGPIMSNVERPTYEVLEKHAAIEIRQYAPRLVANVTTSGSREEAISSGFKILADFIFGNNTPPRDLKNSGGNSGKTQIAMTAPVEQIASGTKWTTGFNIPAEFTLETLPKPNSLEIKLVEKAAQKFISITFSGSNTSKNVMRHESTLKEFISENNMRVKGSAVYAFYNPPWTLPLFRRNEVLFAINE